ncbi:hypothetical protein TNCT_80161 [Trichonephila clavata]|uniref:Uncharacterized protein n=1 Tax=Trichonephila clavata TaxID=2740835 RepID=A0A8X6FE86_TRICU|nr:hypothetical protein TNCT_80161 [Trichonephila clavata]
MNIVCPSVPKALRTTTKPSPSTAGERGKKRTLFSLNLSPSYRLFQKLRELLIKRVPPPTRRRYLRGMRDWVIPLSVTGTCHTSEAYLSRPPSEPKSVTRLGNAGNGIFWRHPTPSLSVVRQPRPGPVALPLGAPLH